MSLSIQINPLFNTSLRHKNINPFIKTFTKEKPNPIQIENFFGIHPPQAIEKINELTHPNEASDTESALKKVAAFYELKEMVCPAYQHKFQAVITQKEDQTYTFSFSIEGIIDTCTCVFGQGRKKRASIEKAKWNPHDVKYNDIPEKPQRTFFANQKRWALHLLKPKKQSASDIGTI